LLALLGTHHIFHASEVRVKKGYQSRANMVKNEKGDFFADTHSILAGRRKYFSQLLNEHGVNDINARSLNAWRVVTCVRRNKGANSVIKFVSLD